MQSFVTQIFISFTDLMLMDKILHHLKWLKPCKSWDVLHINWCRILSVNGMFTCLQEKNKQLRLRCGYFILTNLITSISTPKERGHWSRWSPRLTCCQACISRVKEYQLLSCERVMENCWQGASSKQKEMEIMKCKHCLCYSQWSPS